MKKIIEDSGLIVIFRGVDKVKAPKIANALYNAGVKVVEIAFNPSDENTIETTTGIIKAIIDEMGEKLVVGAGTVISTEFVQAAYEAGAKFIFSPNTDVEVIKKTKELGLTSIPGSLTPSEMMTAYNAGADLIKLFPITKDDVDYVKGIARPLSHIPYICVGGTNLDTIECFIKAGAKGVATGISILKPELIENEDYAEMGRLAKLHLEKIKEARENL
ncbi:MAG: bifunctional 4-hydroxy-2-oxoglutarate aldolase/2-dehydro-3-deoxy-phosphogluconate aldolase [Clostridia bacterium]|nr:bifunctional 4-hydroxy-2-oxoglutarate aldolase/2-dehydro-3-deoxy-phosphogluconate aldolase [Clostridia bacterium]